MQTICSNPEKAQYDLSNDMLLLSAYLLMVATGELNHIFNVVLRWRFKAFKDYISISPCREASYKLCSNFCSNQNSKFIFLNVSVHLLCYITSNNVLSSLWN